MAFDRDELTRELARLLNRHSVDNDANTPDYILAEYLVGCLVNYQATLEATRQWHQWPTLAERLRLRLQPPYEWEK